MSNIKKFSSSGEQPKREIQSSCVVPTPLGPLVVTTTETITGPQVCFDDFTRTETSRGLNGSHWMNLHTGGVPAPLYSHYASCRLPVTATSKTEERSYYKPIPVLSLENDPYFKEEAYADSVRYRSPKELQIKVKDIRQTEVKKKVCTCYSQKRDSMPKIVEDEQSNDKTEEKETKEKPETTEPDKTEKEDQETRKSSVESEVNEYTGMRNVGIQADGKSSLKDETKPEQSEETNQNTTSGQTKGEGSKEISTLESTDVVKTKADKRPSIIRTDSSTRIRGENKDKNDEEKSEETLKRTDSMKSVRFADGESIDTSEKESGVKSKEEGQKSAEKANDSDKEKKKASSETKEKEQKSTKEEKNSDNEKKSEAEAKEKEESFTEEDSKDKKKKYVTEYAIYEPTGFSKMDYTEAIVSNSPLSAKSCRTCLRTVEDIPMTDMQETTESEQVMFVTEYKTNGSDERQSEKRISVTLSGLRNVVTESIRKYKGESTGPTSSYVSSAVTEYIQEFFNNRVAAKNANGSKENVNISEESEHIQNIRYFDNSSSDRTASSAESEENKTKFQRRNAVILDKVIIKPPATAPLLGIISIDPDSEAWYDTVTELPNSVRPRSTSLDNDDRSVTRKPEIRGSQSLQTENVSDSPEVKDFSSKKQKGNIQKVPPTTNGTNFHSLSAHFIVHSILNYIINQIGSSEVLEHRMTKKKNFVPQKKIT